MLIMNLILSAAIAAALPVTENSGKAQLQRAQLQPFSQNGLAPWNAGAVDHYAIHSSCNATQSRQIETGLNETIALAEHAKAHILRWKNESSIYRKYFGNQPTFEAVGAYDAVINGDKKNILFRCDNPDGNCRHEGWAGHWRGKNATDETVICDLSYETRRSLSTICGLGYTVSEWKTNTFWATDLLHRLYHVPSVGQNLIDHFADGHKGVLEQALNKPELSTHDSETLQYFALEVYAYDIAVPGIGCAGAQPKLEKSHTAATTTTADKKPSTTTEAAKNCHTHAGGELHCV